MSDAYPPAHRALLELIAAGTDLDVITRALDTLEQHPLAGGIDDAEREAMRALRAEVRLQVGAVRAAEPGAGKRLAGLLNLLIAAQLRHLQRAPKVV